MPLLYFHLCHIRSVCSVLYCFNHTPSYTETSDKRSVSLCAACLSFYESLSSLPILAGLCQVFVEIPHTPQGEVCCPSSRLGPGACLCPSCVLKYTAHAWDTLSPDHLSKSCSLHTRVITHFRPTRQWPEKELSV